MKKLLSILLAVVLVFSLAGCSLEGTIDNAVNDFKTNVQDAVNDGVNDVKDAIGNPQEWLDKSEPDAPTDSQSITQMTVLDVGQGLSVLIESNGEYALYDGGDRTASSYVVSYLKKHNITKIKYMIASHYDDDHINGLVGVLKNYDIENIIGPDYTTDTRVYKSFVEEIKTQGKTVIHPNEGDTYSFGNAKLTVIAPNKGFDTDDNNEKSIVMKLTTETYTCLITGDAGEESEKYMLNKGANVSADILIVGHHGSSGSSTAKFLDKVKPELALISVGKGNMYKHPSDKTLDRLNDRNIPIVRTDESGEITIKCVNGSYEIVKQKK